MTWKIDRRFWLDQFYRYLYKTLVGAMISGIHRRFTWLNCLVELGWMIYLKLTSRILVASVISEKAINLSRSMFSKVRPKEWKDVFCKTRPRLEKDQKSRSPVQDPGRCSYPCVLTMILDGSLSWEIRLSSCNTRDLHYSFSTSHESVISKIRPRSSSDLWFGRSNKDSQ